jgi:hypothetical protein
MWETISRQRDVSSAADIITDNRIAGGGGKCPLRAGHTLKNCTAPSHQHKCINCTPHNQYSKKEKICENHPSLSKKCPSLHAVLTKYRQNTDY